MYKDTPLKETAAFGRLILLVLESLIELTGGLVWMPATDPTTSGFPTPTQRQPSPAPKISSLQVCEFYACWIMDMGNLTQMIRKWSCAVQFATV